MKLKHPLSTFAAIGTLLFAPLALANSITIENLAREAAIRSVSMSPEGDMIVAIVAAPGSDYKETALATWDLNDLEAGPVVTPSGDKMKFIGANALKAGMVNVTARQEWTGELGGCGEGSVIGNTATFVVKSYLTDKKHQEFEEAFAETGYRMGMSDRMRRCMEISGSANLVSTLPLDPTKVLIRRTDRTDLRSDYFLYDLKTKKTDLLFRGNDDTAPALFDPRNGEVLVRSDTESKGKDYEQTYFMREGKDGDFVLQPALTTMLSERYTQNVVGINEATGEFYVLTNRFSDKIQAYTYNPKTGAWSDPLVGSADFNIASLIFDRRPATFNQIVGYAVQGPEFDATYIDPDMSAIHEGLKAAFKGQNVNLRSYNNDLSRILFTTGNNKNPTAYHVLKDRKTVTTLGKERPWIDPQDIGEQKWVTYTARDGMKIPAILDLPPNWTKDQGPLPTVIHPHGGPWARDYMGYDVSGWVPYMTARGYAVLRPQYRGSNGLGRELWMAGDAEWGQKMQDDKDDGAYWLVEQGIADKDKIAIFGYSYGGFAAAAAVVRPDGPYQCAISGAPVTDLARLGNNWSQNRLQRRFQGVTVKGMDPMENTEKADIPVLLFVGSRDVRTPKWHAENFYKGVKDKVPAQYELIPDMPHSLPWYPRHFESMFSLMNGFFENECGFGKPTVASR